MNKSASGNSTYEVTQFIADEPERACTCGCDGNQECTCGEDVANDTVAGRQAQGGGNFSVGSPQGI